jgi:DNA-binding NarL/FixJ family response regulator
MLDDAVPVDADTRRRGTGGMVAANQRSFKTVLLGRNALLLEGLKHILDSSDFRIIACAPAVEELDLRPVQGDRTLLFILDSDHDLQNAIRQVERCKQLCPDARVAILCKTDAVADLASLFQVGANACFLKDVSTPTLLKSLELVMTGLTLLPSGILSLVIARNGLSPQTDRGARHLSAQEERVLEGLVEGHCNKIIARELGIAVATVKVHVKAILRKTGLRNRTQAAAWAISQSKRVSSTSETKPKPFLAPAEPRSTSPNQERMAMPPLIAHEGSNRDVTAETVTVSGGRATQVMAPTSDLLHQLRVMRLQRRAAEEEESHNALIANMKRLRELRMASDLQEATDQAALSRVA